MRAKVLREWQPFAVERPPLVPSLGQLVPGVMKRLGLHQRLWESQLLSRWAEIVGEFNARISQPASLRNGRLIITVEHSARIQELRPLKSKWLEAIQRRLGNTCVRDIIFRVG